MPEIKSDIYSWPLYIWCWIKDQRDVLNADCQLNWNMTVQYTAITFDDCYIWHFHEGKLAGHNGDED